MSSRVGLEIDAVDNASAKVREVGDTTVDALEKVKRKTNEVDAANKELKKQCMNVVTGLSGVATSAFALYSGFDRLQTVQLTADKANLTLQRSQESLKDAQEALTAAIAKYGANSPQAVDATKKLEIAQQALEVAQDRASISAENVGQSQMGFALSVVPTVITMSGSLITMLGGLKAMHLTTASATGVLSAAQGALNFVMNMNPIMIVVMALAALAAAFVWAYYNIEPVRNVINALGSAIMGGLVAALNVLGAVWGTVVGGMKALYDVTIGPIIAGLQWFAETVGNVWSALMGGGGEGTPAETATPTGTYYDEYGEPIRGQHGFSGTVSRPTLFLAGEAGTEHVSITPGGGSGEAITIQGPLVQIMGSADRATAEYAARLVEERLRNVLVESSSASAPSTHKRIRLGSVI